MDDHRHGVDHFTIDAHVQLHQIRGAITGDFIIHRSVTAANRFQPIIKIYHNLIERQLVHQHGALRPKIANFFLTTTLLFADLEHAAEEFLGQVDGGFDHRLFDPIDFRFVRQPHRIIDHQHRAVYHHDPIDDGRRSGDQAEAELPLEPLTYDIHMQEAKKTAAKSKAQRLRGLRLISERGIVQPELFERVAQGLILTGVGRIKPAEYHRLHRLESRQRLIARPIVGGYSVADLGFGDFLNSRHDKAHFARPQFGDLHGPR